MSKGRVLVIDGDEWVARLLAAGLRDHGFDVSTMSTGSAGLDVAHAIEPDCIVTEMALPDTDGPALVRTIRGDAGPIAIAPIVFLTNAEDTASRLAAFHAGGDVYLTKPFRVEEVAMQVQALVSMTARLRGRRDSLRPYDSDVGPESTAAGQHAIEGNLDQMSIATVLTLLEMEHRSGVLTISSKTRKCTLDMVGGFACAGTIGGSRVSPLAVLRHVLVWKEGRFRFRPGTDAVLPADRRSIGALLIEAVRLDDESAQAKKPGEEAEEAPTQRRNPVPASSPPASSRKPLPSVPSKRLSRPPPQPAPPKSRPPTSSSSKRASRPPAPPTAAKRLSRPPPPLARVVAPRPAAVPPPISLDPNKKN